MSDMKENEDLIEECMTCLGRGVRRNRYITLLDPCPHCGGKGSSNWIDNAMPALTPCDNNILLKVAHENVYVLVQEIIVQYRRLGVDVNVDIRQMHNHRYETEPPLVWKGKRENFEDIFRYEKLSIPKWSPP